jgi:hypothetical protein
MKMAPQIVRTDISSRKHGEVEPFLLRNDTSSRKTRPDGGARDNADRIKSKIAIGECWVRDRAVINSEFGRMHRSTHLTVL